MLYESVNREVGIVAGVDNRKRPVRMRQWDDEADVAIVGGGGAGLAAGIEAREQGASVIVIEKETHNRMANSARCVGIFAVESSLQKERNIHYSRDEAFKQAVTYAHWQNNAALVRAIVDKSASTIDWLLRHGVQFREVSAGWPGCPQTWHMLTGDPLHPQLLPVLTKAADQVGVKMIYSAPATNLIMGRRKRIIGVEADASGKPFRIRARRGVILSSGGFGSNKEMLKKYTKWNKRFKNMGCQSNTGDGIRMAEAAGASLESMDVLMISQVKKTAPGELWVPSMQAFLFVNKDGERVADESMQRVWPEMGNIILRQKDQTVIVIFDEDSKNALVNIGAKVGFHGVFWWEGKKATGLDEDIKRGLKRGLIKKANTIRALAAAIEIDSATLENTIDRYNQACHRKHDDIFLKESQFLEPVKKPPFYAMICARPEYYVTLGGASINAKCQVLDTKNNVIPGLYAAGNDAGGMWTGCYNLYMCGGASGFALNSGRIAGENAVAEVSSTSD
jgi:fumarate reductase flavoprotein subunit